jgi:hypothetical protein
MIGVVISLLYIYYYNIYIIEKRRFNIMNNIKRFLYLVF